MKDWTKKFINREVEDFPEGTNLEQACLTNAEKAEKQIGLPEKLWIELSNSDFYLLESIEKNGINKKLSLFLAGVAVGWAEKNKEIK